MKRIILLIAGICLCAGAVQAQEEELFGINPDTRALAMGGLAMTNVSGSQALFNNPASPAFSTQEMQLSGSYMPLDNNHYFAVSGFYNFDGRNILEAGWRRHTYAPGTNHMSFELGYARRLGEKWSIGAALRYYRFYYYWGGRSDNALSVDLSAMYSQPLNFGEYSTLRLGGKIGNLGSYLKGSHHLPISISAGAAIDTFITDAHEVTLGVDLNCITIPDSNSVFGLAVGVEYNLMQLIQLRAGYNYNPNSEIYSSYGSVGAGVRFLHMRVDFAYLICKYRPLHNAWSISLGLDF